jgi:hypothetical protein
MTSEAARRRAMLDPVHYLPGGPIPAWFLNGVAEAIGQPCDCGLTPYDHHGHAAGCRAGEAWAALLRRAGAEAESVSTEA